MGSCNRCGICCMRKPSRTKLGCDFLVFESNGDAFCTIYKNRPESCKTYPPDQKFLLKGCSYKFVPDGLSK